MSNLTDLLDCYDVDNNALITNSSVVGFGSSESEWFLGIGNFFWFFGIVVIDQSNWQVGRKRSEKKLRKYSPPPPTQSTVASKPGAGALGFILAGLAWMALSLGKILVMRMMN